MGCFDKCCCCLSKKTSAIVCTIIVLVYSVYILFNTLSIISNYDTSIKTDAVAKELNIHIAYYYTGLGFNILIIVTLICLLIGISKEKLSLMRPFKYIYGLYMIEMIAEIGYFAYVMNGFVKKLTSNEQELAEFCDLYFRGSYNVEKECQDYKNVVNSVACMAVAILAIPFFIELLYYITTFNYIRSVEKDQKEVDDIKNIENAY